MRARELESVCVYVCVCVCVCVREREREREREKVGSLCTSILCDLFVVLFWIHLLAYLFIAFQYYSTNVVCWFTKSGFVAVVVAAVTLAGW